MGTTKADPAEPTSPLTHVDHDGPGASIQEASRAVTFPPEHPSQDDTLSEDESGTDDGSAWDGEDEDDHNGAPASEANDKTTANVSLSLEELQRMIKEEFGRLHQKLDQNLSLGSTGVAESQGPARPRLRAAEPAAFSERPMDAKSAQPEASQRTATPGSSSSAEAVLRSLLDEATRFDPGSTPERHDLLFDTQGNPTGSLEHLLSELAHHVINEGPSTKAGVVTPDKLASFYANYAIDQDVYPFAALFEEDSKDTRIRLADLFQDLGCEYHLIQADIKSRPVIPGLTVSGFTRWLTTLMLAYPDAEAQRLEKILPILLLVSSHSQSDPKGNLTGAMHQFFPDRPDTRTKRLLEEAMRDFMEDSNLFSGRPAGKRRSEPSGRTSAEYASGIIPKSPTSRRTYSDDVFMSEHSQTYLPPPPVGNFANPRRSGRSPVPGERYRKSFSDLGSVPTAATLTAYAQSPPAPLGSSSELGRSLERSGAGEYTTTHAPYPARRSSFRRLARPGEFVDPQDTVQPERAIPRHSMGLAGAGPTWDEYLRHRPSPYGSVLLRDGSYRTSG